MHTKTNKYIQYKIWNVFLLFEMLHTSTHGASIQENVFSNSA